MIKDLFKEISVQGSYYASSRDGDQFEQKFKNKLKAYGYSEIIQVSETISSIKEIANLQGVNLKIIKEKHMKIKEKILAKNSVEVVLNPYNKISNTFIFQPFGSQNFPDFILFTNKYIIPIEIKFSKNDKPQKNLNKFRPMWNSNMPKPNAIYIYGVAAEKVTFFLGSDILNFDTRQVLLDFFKNLDLGKEKLDSKLEILKNDFGIYPYIRKAYDHAKNHSTFIDIDGKKIVQSYFSKQQEERQKNVISFLTEIEDNTR